MDYEAVAGCRTICNTVNVDERREESTLKRVIDVR
jgi:hypothetical protein